jgi:transcriptional regulator with XRE-family HTH domain
VDADRFPARLKELREDTGLSQQGLADRVGISVRQISRLETGAQVATWPTAVALAKALGVSCEAFLEEPTLRPEAVRGRPPKAAAAPAEAPKPKRTRGRPRKGC